jgi:UDP-N-acetylglucosamine--N-acetylmuramyl-(pentapeptide) pyrophosphoryl-undecaprenol N-acetylglucosamine transferase
VVLAIGGSQGSKFINNMICASLKELLGTFQVCHIAGKGNLKEELCDTTGYRQYEYVTDELPHLFAMADIIVTRGGATSLFEILALNKPNVIIPYSLKASRGDQIINAESFKRQGFSEVLPESADVTSSIFMNTLIDVYNNKSRYIAAMQGSAARNGLENVIKVICKTAGVML